MQVKKTQTTTMNRLIVFLFDAMGIDVRALMARTFTGMFTRALLIWGLLFCCKLVLWCSCLED